jgi:asparagine synthase (glutamine-hydrolysing)
MCGILGLVRATSADSSTAPLRTATELVRHRGPDDEGYLLWDGVSPSRVYAGAETSSAARNALRLGDMPNAADWQVAFGHRRLSIVDLSPAGHQPMVHRPSGLAVCYNGEIYNHVELRRELSQRGHSLRSHSDTEVLLHAWLEWGPDAMSHFNGMFAFVLLDPRNGGSLYAVRDRYGVKPLYYARISGLIAFASEIKQLRSLPGFAPSLDEGVARDYLAFGLVDHTSRTFDARISQLRGGERAVVSLSDPQLSIHVERWYDLRATPFRGSPGDAANEFRTRLGDSVRFRLRADVPVGSCLSGGLDSSAIVCLAHEALDGQDDVPTQITITACYEEQRYDEWRYAEQVVRQTGAHAVRVWPNVERLQSELDLQLWHLDEPVGSTSQFSQWCVFGAAAEAGLKVMLDGQGSDEQLAGYGGSDAALYSGLLRRGSVGRLASEVLSFRRRHGGLPIAQLLLALRNTIPAMDALLPPRVRLDAAQPDWLISRESGALSRLPSHNLNEYLKEQLLITSLPVLLRYEDRNSMAWSVESRVPFLDYGFVEFLAGIPDGLKLRDGVTKCLMRDALRGLLPESIRTRRDKMGFVTPEEVWLTRTATDWFREGVATAVEASPQLFDPDKTLKMLEASINGKRPFTFEPWRILCFGRWLTDVASGCERPAAEHRA